MTEAERNALERFAEQTLAGKLDAAVDRAFFVRKGYDVDLLDELIAQYAALPTAKRRYHFGWDSAGERSGDVLLIRRVI